MDEVRMSFRFFASVLIRRAQKVFAAAAAVATAVLTPSLPRNKDGRNTVLWLWLWLSAGGHSCRLR